MDNIGENIRRLRKKNRWSQKELADISGLGEKYISALETGKRRPGDEAIDKLCDAFTEPEQVLRFGGNDLTPERRVDPLTRMIIDTLAQLPESAKPEVLAVALKMKEAYQRSI